MIKNLILYLYKYRKKTFIYIYIKIKNMFNISNYIKYILILL